MGSRATALADAEAGAGPQLLPALPFPQPWVLSRQWLGPAGAGQPQQRAHSFWFSFFRKTWGGGERKTMKCKIRKFLHLAPCGDIRVLLWGWEGDLAASPPPGWGCSLGSPARTTGPRGAGSAPKSCTAAPWGNSRFWGQAKCLLLVSMTCKCKAIRRADRFTPFPIPPR